MTATDHRAHSRKSCKSGITYAYFNANDFSLAKMYNFSETGMYFQSDQLVRPSSDICIRLKKCRSKAVAPPTHRFYRAKVRWCRERPHKRRRSYGVGVQYVVNHPTIQGPVYVCGLCEAMIPYGEIHQVDEFAYACARCFQNFDALPEGLIKHGIENFMLGNVL